MILKEYIDKCTWGELKTTQGAKEYMQRSLADLQRIEPKYTDNTPKYCIHFSENTDTIHLLAKMRGNTDWDNCVKYAAFISHTYALNKTQVYQFVHKAREEILSFEVVIAEGQMLADSEIVVSVIEELTVRDIDRYIQPVQNTEGKWGFEDKRSGELVIPYQYDSAEDFIAGKAEVILGGGWAMIDETGKIII